VPLWLHEKGGFAAADFPALFERYCDRAAAALGDRIAYACTLNEPQGLGSSGWLLGITPPGHNDDREGAQHAVDNLLEAHRRGAAMRELTETDQTTQMGYEFYPRAIGGAIRRAHRSCPGVPILVTENGIATTNDDKRIAYIDAAMREVLTCMGEGIDVRSYLYW